MNKFLTMAAGSAVCIGAVAPAAAHVGLEYTVAPAGSHYKATFQIGHGCDAASTRQVVVTIPAGVSGARPMPKPGWELTIERGKRQPGDAKDEVLRVRWTARSAADMLPTDQYDEFALVGRVPDQPGPLYWPVEQVCEGGARQDWSEVPAGGRAASALKSPAPVLNVLPAAGAAGHTH